jgi:hypothetical protein
VILSRVQYISTRLLHLRTATAALDCLIALQSGIESGTEGQNMRFSRGQTRRIAGLQDIAQAPAIRRVFAMRRCNPACFCNAALQSGAFLQCGAAIRRVFCNAALQSGASP